MITKTVKYIDFDGNEQEDTFQFNMNAAEFVKLDASQKGGLIKSLQNLVEIQNNEEIYKILESLLLDTIGRKSQDGKRFIKTDPDTVALFTESNAMSEMIIEFLQNPDRLASFMEGLTAGIVQSPQAKKDHPVLKKV